jgi:hypothetical protein
MRLIRIFVVLGLLIPLPGIAGESNTTIGIGTGITYGGVGLSLEQMVNDQTGVALGVGGNSVDISSSFGVNYYFSEDRTRLRYRLSTFYGFVASSTCEDCIDDRFDKTFSGLAIGGGLTWKHFELSLFYRDISDFEDHRDELESRGAVFEEGELSKTTITFGYLF